MTVFLRLETMIHRFPSISLLVFASVVVSACSGPTGQRSPSPIDLPEPRPTTVTIRHADYEAWDPAPYAPAAVKDTIITLAHDVPDALMENRADAGVEVQVPGFRIQVLSTREKIDADTQWEDAITWWQNLSDERRPAGYFEDGLPVEVVYRQPYYRVRLGNFRTREEAETILPFLQRRFTSAFIIPDTIKLRR